MSATDPSAYRVLARKYRPQTFAELIGQEALVRTLSNAIERNRIAHAFVLTGVRGVGKTTTARILARSLNCIGADGAGGPTVTPCGVCPSCVSILEDRAVDIMEMDAASRTGVEDIRELIDGVRYRPVALRYKVYVIDEVHMLSKNAFNALLKTLEEPPEHTKFIFATTELRKIPVTVLSRCQRFDLRRVSMAELSQHFTRIAELEGARLSADAAALIARAADGSVRDGLSLLDQAIALALHEGAEAPISADLVRDMLGLADRTLVYDVFEAVMKGAVPDALNLYAAMHARGVDPLQVMQDLLELTHTITRVKLAGDGEDGIAQAEAERVRARALAAGLSIPVLTRAWQILLKGVSEVQAAGDGRAAVDMVLIRLGFVSDLSPPGELARMVAGQSQGGGTGSASLSIGGQPGGSAPPQAPRAGPPPRVELVADTGSAMRAVAPQADHAPAAMPSLPDPQSFEAVVALFAERREPILRGQLAANCRLVRFEPGRIEIQPDAQAPRDLANRVGDLLTGWTGRRWVVTIAGSGGGATLREQAEAAERDMRASAVAHPLVAAYLEAFPGAEVSTVRALEPEPTSPEIEPEEAEDQS